MRLRIEPTCILWLIHRGIASVQVGNRARKVLPLPDGVEHEDYGKAQWWQQGQEEPGGGQTIVNKPLLFSPGFNCRIYPRVGNRLQFEAGSGLGMGEVQTDLSKGFRKVSGRMIEEETPTNYLRKDGLPDDGDILYAFCGAVGPHVQMTATTTIRLTAEPEKHCITISVGNLGGDIC
jgi:hypothetical protein